MRTPEEIVRVYKQRERDLLLLHQGMYSVRDVYYNNITIDLPEFDNGTKPSVPNLLQQGVDQMAGRVASVLPSPEFASTNPGKRNADRKARTAADVISAWWAKENLRVKHETRARHLVAYGMSPVVIRWNEKEKRPFRDVRQPLTCYPDPDAFAQPHEARDAIFTYMRSVGWLRSNGYGYAVEMFRNHYDQEQSDQEMFTLVEYVDTESHQLLLVGLEPNGRDSIKTVPLTQYDHGLGMLPASIPFRTGLDTLQGQFDGMVDMYKAQAHLTALEIIAVEKGIFPDTYLVSRPNEIGRFIDGPHDGRSGKVNVVAGGDIRTEQTAPGYLTNPTIDRLERAQRQNGGIPAEWGGESPTNVRTGRRGDAVLAAATDVTLAGCQAIFKDALEYENAVCVELAKKRDGGATRTIFVGTGQSQRKVTYVAKDVFETTEHALNYPAIGSDINALSIGLGQRVGMGTMSKETAAERDPWIDNPEIEKDRITGEALEAAMLAGIQQQAQAGALPPAVLSRIIQIVKSDKLELAEAVQKATEEFIAKQQQEQAAAAQAQQGPMGPPGMEEAIAGPGAAAMTGAPPAAIPGANEGQQNLSGLLASLRMPAMAVQPMRGVEEGAV